MFENLFSHELYSIFDISGIVLISIGVFLCWWNRESRSTKTKADGAQIGQSKADDATQEGKGE